MRLEIRHAAFSYHSNNVFEDINLVTNEAEFFSILGPNGCGKTTLLKCLAGMLNLKRGTILVDGIDISYFKRRETATRLSYIPQEHTPTFPFTVQQMVLMGRAPYLNAFSSPSARDMIIAEEAIERVGITQLKDRRYTEISGGERQLVLIARVLAQQPKILLLDEPTSHLDFRNQVLILRLLSRLAGDGLTVIMTTHFPNHVFNYSSRVAIMNDHRFMAVGKPNEVITEKRLRDTYGISVKIFSVIDPDSGDGIRFCVPEKEPRYFNRRID